MQHANAAEAPIAKYVEPQGYAKWFVRTVAKLTPRAFFPREIYARQARRRSGMRVLKGPFKGMRYVDAAVGSVFLPKLVGTYEQELADVIERACALRPSLVVDIGAAEGYYAVGLAYRLPHAAVVAFEMDEQGRSLLRSMAALNGVGERIDVRGKCEPDDLRAALASAGDAGATLVVCDVEGYEEVLLDPNSIRTLASCHVLVELHDFLIPGISQTLRERFAATHDIERFTQRPAVAEDFPYDSLFRRLTPSAYVVRAIGDFRPEVMSWYWMTPKT